MALAGCAAQKSGNNPGKSTAEEVLYTQALKALEERNFIIKIDEFHFPSDKAPVNSTNSYVSMQGSHAVIRMSQDFPSQIPSNRNTESDNAEITKGTTKKNGDMQFSMKIKGGLPRQSWEFLIVLYKNTNQRFVNINRGHSGQNIVNFKGYVYPLATE